MSIFTSTVTASEFREDLKTHLEKVQTSGDALQIIHRGQPIRVVITQEEYLDLKQKSFLYELAARGDTLAPDELVQSPSKEEVIRKAQNFVDEYEVRESRAAERLRSK